MSIFFSMLVAFGFGYLVGHGKPQGRQEIPSSAEKTVDKIINEAGTPQGLYDWGYDRQESLVAPPFNRWRNLGYAEVADGKPRRDVAKNPPTVSEWRSYGLPATDEEPQGVNVFQPART